MWFTSCKRARLLTLHVPVTHASELFNVYGQDVILPHVEADFLDIPMVDYWLSFATSLDPNDGRGEARLSWPQYSLLNPVSLLMVHI